MEEVKIRIDHVITSHLCCTSQRKKTILLTYAYLRRFLHTAFELGCSAHWPVFNCTALGSSLFVTILRDADSASGRFLATHTVWRLLVLVSQYQYCWKTDNKCPMFQNTWRTKEIQARKLLHLIVKDLDVHHTSLNSLSSSAAFLLSFLQTSSQDTRIAVIATIKKQRQITYEIWYPGPKTVL